MGKIRILIYGDSNTHGYRTDNGLRYEKDERWTGVCQSLVGDNIEILEEGLNGRTTSMNEYGMEFRNGMDHIYACIKTHLPLDMVCVMLGTNDLKKEFSRRPQDIARDCSRIMLMAKQAVDSKYPNSECRYLLIAPVEVSEDIISGDFASAFEGKTTVERSRELIRCCRSEAEKNKFLFFDASGSAKACRRDGIHLDKENHFKLGQSMAEYFTKCFDLRQTEEILDVVDQEGRPTGATVDRKTAHRDGITHRTSHLWIMRQRGGRVQVLLQKRSRTKDSYPGMYDISSAGHIPCGQGYAQSALRELEEELGVKADYEDLIFCGKRRIFMDEVFHGEPFHDDQVSNIYCIWLDMEPEQFVLQKSEVEEVVWMDMDKCKAMADGGNSNNCIYREELDMLPYRRL